MKLAELSPAYRVGGEAITGRIEELRKRLKAEKDPEARRILRRRIRELRPMQRQCEELAELTARYYERGYCRDERYTI